MHRRGDSVVPPVALYYRSCVLGRACVSVLTVTGERVALSKLIRAGPWPLVSDLLEEVGEIARMKTNERTVMVLVPMS